MTQICLKTKIKVDFDLNKKLNCFYFIANKTECENLCERFGFLSVHNLSARIEIRELASDCWDLKGKIKGFVTQSCRASGEPVCESIDFSIEERYVRSLEQQTEVEVSLYEAEPLNNGVLDLGEVISQSLMMGVDPWPRVAGMPEQFFYGESSSGHSFTALAALKARDKE